MLSLAEVRLADFNSNNRDVVRNARRVTPFDLTLAKLLEEGLITDDHAIAFRTMCRKLQATSSDISRETGLPQKRATAVLNELFILGAIELGRECYVIEDVHEAINCLMEAARNLRKT